MDVTDEVKIIGPGYKRRADSIHRGFWTPELANWSDKKSFVKKEALIKTVYDETGGRTTGAEVNACPIICITKDYVGHQDLTVSVTGNQGILDSGATVTYSGVTLTGYTSDNQYGETIYRRKYVTGGSQFKYEFTIPAHTDVGKVYEFPTKRIYEITNVRVTPRNVAQPLTDISFYALADNGSKLLYSTHWNKIFEYGRKVIYGGFGNPRQCQRCNGTGTISGTTCVQCSGYKYSGPNASGILATQIGFDEGITRDDDDTDKVWRNKLWAMKWWINPTVSEIKRYFAHFAGLESSEVDVTGVDRTSGPTGVEKIIDVDIPYTLPNAIFGSTDDFWDVMKERAEPAAIPIRLAFVIQYLTGQLPFEDMVSVHRSGYYRATYTGGAQPGAYGFYEPFMDGGFETYGPGNYYNDYSTDWFYFNLNLSGVHESGDDAVSGYATVSGGTYDFIHGDLEGSEWIKWAWPNSGNAHLSTWHTGISPDVSQTDLWNSGVFYWDNFWASGAGGLQY